MSHFAPYEPDATPAADPLDPGCVRVARPEDAEAITRISAERDGAPPETIRPRIEAELAGLGDGPWCVFVADVDGAVAAYGRARDLTHAEGGLPPELPEGWYLTGVVVAPAFRRRGLGAALTEARLAWLEDRTDTVYYVANLVNRASIDLHAGFGFTEIARGFDYPRAGLAAGDGAAYGLTLGSGR